ncbi:rhodanese-like domain-containing protein [Salininema proteolyticum]|uniref:Rhodanese-like domain-containing protein n=1 Tax=Salininema proteolyticum TaxID=1607685 RepID=A0ABV8TWH6_9ACTN
MIITQYYLDCLSQATYLVADESTGRAILVDPRRDIGEFLDDAAERGLTIEGVVNTHFHADFVAGHLETAAATGAWIGYGRRAETEYPVRHLAHGERIGLGEVELEVWETPGHTPESISLLVYERAGDAVPYGVLTGDVLFNGDVGRPDLLASEGVTSDELAAMLYDSVHNRLMSLEDEVRVYPAHGAGSACGKNLQAEAFSTIGVQRTVNYACRPMPEEEFVELVTSGQPAAPGYFGYDAAMNKADRNLLDLEVTARPLSAEEVSRARLDGAVVVDARSPGDFAAAHLAGSVNIPAEGRFAETAGSVLSPGDTVVVMAPEGVGEETVMRLGRIGFDNVAGYAADSGAVLAASTEVERSERIGADVLRGLLERAEAPVVVDVRSAGEREQGFIDGSVHIPLAELTSRLDEVPEGRPVVVHCAGGYRSTVAASLLRRRHGGEVTDLLGGYGAWASAEAA